MVTPLCIAHRGASAEAPENTLRAFRRALALGADGIELDAQVTRDGVAMVFHDDTLARLTGVRGKLTDHTFAELQKLHVRGEPIPTLADALAAVGDRAVVQIEIKKNAPVAPVLQAIRQAGPACRVILASFEHTILQEAAERAPSLSRMLIADAPKQTDSPKAAALSLLETMASVGASGISVNHNAIKSALFVETMREQKTPLWCWTVNDTPTMLRLAQWGVDAILSDDPARLKMVLHRG